MEPTFTITKTEISFLKLIAAGYNALEAGEKLGAAPNTGRTHADHIRAKLNVQTIEGAATLAMQFGYFSVYDVEVRLKNPSKLPMWPLPYNNK